MKILFLQKRLLFPHNTGGKIRTLNVLRYLARRHEVTYVCNMLQEEAPYLAQMESLGVTMKTVDWTESPRRSFQFLAFAVANLFSSRPLNVDKDYDRRLRRLVETEVKTEEYDLLICDFVQMARNCLGLKLPKLLFQHNVEAEIFERLAERKRGLFASYLSLQAGRMRRFEASAGRDFDQVVAVSERDQQRFKQDYGLPHVDVIETAVDTQYFQPTDESADRSGVVFVGSMDWPPNVDGMHHFVNRIWPLVRQVHPDATLTIVGRNPPSSINEHHGRQGITVTGTVSDIRPYLMQAAVGIVPLFSGGGTRLKIFEYMAMKLPVIATSLGAEGLPVQNDVHLIIRDEDERFADALNALLSNQPRRREIGQAAFDLVRQRHSADRVAQQFEQYCEQAVSNWKADEE